MGCLYSETCLLHCVFHCVIWHPVYSDTKSYSQCKSDLTDFTVCVWKKGRGSVKDQEGRSIEKGRGGGRGSRSTDFWGIWFCFWGGPVTCITWNQQEICVKRIKAGIFNVMIQDMYMDWYILISNSIWQ